MKDDIDVVEIDGMVLLKILKHCKENLPTQVTGLLLGMDVSKTLQVTNCFPFLTKASDEVTAENEEAESTKYQLEMMRCLREVNVDSNTVGWYTSTNLESYISLSLIETQYSYQCEFGHKCVCLVYDPVKTEAECTLSCKAFRLRNGFMKLYKENTFTQESLNKAGIKFQDIFEEVPIKLHNSLLVQAFLLDLSTDSPFNVNADTFCDAERLNLGSQSYLERSMEGLIECADDFVLEQNKYQFYQRRLAQQQQYMLKKKAEADARRAAGETPLPEEEDNYLLRPLHQPGRMETLLLGKQASNYCTEIQHFAAANISKMYMAEALHKAATSNESE